MCYTFKIQPLKAIHFLLFLFFTHFACSAQNELVEIPSFGTNPGNLKMFVFSNLKSPENRVPLVVALHGCNQDALSLSILTGWNKIARDQQFIVLYPQQKRINNVSNCFNWFVSSDIESDQGESYSIFEMIQYTTKHYLIDTTQIYITGLSAGGAMSVALMANYPTLFNAGAVIGGGAYKIATSHSDAIKAMRGHHSQPDLTRLVTNLHPHEINTKYPRILIFQGTDDRIVHPKNAEYLKNQWCGVHKIDTIPDIIEKYDLDTNIEIVHYQNGEQEDEVILYKIENLGHKLLISPGTERHKGGKLGIFGHKSKFHSTYQIALKFNLIKQP